MTSISLHFVFTFFHKIIITFWGESSFTSSFCMFVFSTVIDGNKKNFSEVGLEYADGVVELGGGLHIK